MKIYFAGSVTGGREFEKEYIFLSEFLQTKGHVLTHHLAKANITGQGESLDPKHIFQRDVCWLKECDVLIAEVSTPSLGVGYEIALAETLGKRIIGLYNKKSSKKLSGMVRGNPKIELVYYDSLKEAKNALKKALE